MESIEFSKFSGSGNDFIIIDHRDGVLDGADLPTFIRKVCRRQMSVGADGLILIENDAGADFRWRFYNADGSRAEMCGNGARCAARFAYGLGIAGPSMTFLTDAGPIDAEIVGDRVKIRLTPPGELVRGQHLLIDDDTISFDAVNTGVPHVVVMTEDVEQIDVVKLGGAIRRHPHFQPAGTNVDFAQQVAPDKVMMRTYERGVEDETLACGTGAAAVALAVAAAGDSAGPVDVITRSNSRLTIFFQRGGAGFTDVHLAGDARMIYSGRLTSDAWTYPE